MAAVVVGVGLVIAAGIGLQRLLETAAENPLDDFLSRWADRDHRGAAAMTDNPPAALNGLFRGSLRP